MGPVGHRPDAIQALNKSPSRRVRNNHHPKPCEFIGFGAVDVAKPYKSIWFGDIHSPKLKRADELKKGAEGPGGRQTPPGGGVLGGGMIEIDSRPRERGPPPIPG